MSRGDLFANAGYKIASLVMAGFVWFHVTEHRQFERVIEVPLRIVNLPRHLAVVSGIPDGVKLRVRAEGRMINLRTKGINIPLDLSDARPGRVTRLLSTADVEVPEGVHAEILRVLSPGGLILECDSLSSREVRVTPAIQGHPASGFAQGAEPAVEPRTVRLQGPARYVGSLTTVPTEPIDIDDAHESVRADVEISLRGVRGMEALPARVSVTVPVERVESFEMPSVPVTVQAGEAAKGVSWDPKVVKVELRGAPSAFRSWVAQGATLTIDARDLDTGYYAFSAQPGGGRVVKLVPSDDAAGIPRGVSIAAETHEIRALLGLPDFLEIASVTPRVFHILIR